MKNCRKFPFLSMVLIFSFHYTLPSAIGAAAARAGGAGQMAQAREPLTMFGVPARVAAAAGGLSAAQAAGAGQAGQASEPLAMFGVPARTAAAVAGLPRVGLAQERMEGRVAAAVITTDAKKIMNNRCFFRQEEAHVKYHFILMEICLR